MSNEIPDLPPISVDDLLRMIGDLTVTIARQHALIARLTAADAEATDTQPA